MATLPLRIVLDTNVYISAALRGREAEAILQLASLWRVILVASEFIFGELKEKLETKFQWPETQVALFLETMRDLAEIVEPEITLNVVPDDDDDNRILECAVAGGAGLIRTYDKDLLRLKSYQTIGIITPRQFAFYGLSNG
jgi:putative PIN family toxin of toxin-antitoxin system